MGVSVAVESAAAQSHVVSHRCAFIFDEKETAPHLSLPEIILRGSQIQRRLRFCGDQIQRRLRCRSVRAFKPTMSIPTYAELLQSRKPAMKEFKARPMTPPLPPPPEILADSIHQGASLSSNHDPSINSAGGKQILTKCRVKLSSSGLTGTGAAHNDGSSYSTYSSSFNLSCDSSYV
jgi:hypothetical protein